MTDPTRTARWVVSLVIAVVPTLAVVAACSNASNPPPDDNSGPGLDSSVGRTDTGSVKPGKDATADQSEAGDAAGDANDGVADSTAPFETGSNFDAPVFGDVVIGPPDDAASDAIPPAEGGKGNGNVCVQELGWWTVGATLDPTVVGTSAASALNPLLSAQNPLTLADYFSEAGETDAGPQLILISGTETNGVSQQYFPFSYPTSPATLVQTGGSAPVFTATSPAGDPSMGWIRLVDASQTDVWIALTNISATLDAGDPQCQSLSSGTVDAVIPTSAGDTTMVLGSGSTTVATVFGATTSTSPAGWNIRLTFTGQKVEVTFK